jgi:hypothetical protein
MSVKSASSWNQLVDLACESFKVLARNRKRSGTLMVIEEWFDIAAETAERTTPRRDVALMAALQSFPSLLERPLEEEVRTLAEGVFIQVRRALEDELVGRINSLKADVMSERNNALPEEGQEELKHRMRVSWELFAPWLEQAFELTMERDLGEGRLPDLIRDPAAVGAYIEAFAHDAAPEDLDDVLRLLASSPALAGRPAVPSQTFEGCATRTLEEALGEHLVDVFRRFWKRHRSLPA